MAEKNVSFQRLHWPISRSEFHSSFSETPTYVETTSKYALKNTSKQFFLGCQLERLDERASNHDKMSL